MLNQKSIGLVFGIGILFGPAVSWYSLRRTLSLLPFAGIRPIYIFRVSNASTFNCRVSTFLDLGHTPVAVDQGEFDEPQLRGCPEGCSGTHSAARRFHGTGRTDSKKMSRWVFPSLYPKHIFLNQCSHQTPVLWVGEGDGPPQKGLFASRSKGWVVVPMDCLAGVLWPVWTPFLVFF